MIPILYYDWGKLNRKKFAEIDYILKKMTVNSIVNDQYKGKSFLLKPDRLWIQKPNIFEAFEVYHIASTRNHFYYWLNGYKGAYLDFCGIDPVKLKYNRLLIIDEKNRLIHFKHEI
jgi:hypothetical protein